MGHLPFFSAGFPKADDARLLVALGMRQRKHSEHLKHLGKGLKPHFVIPYHRHVETIAELQHPIRIAKIQPTLLQTGLAFLLIPAYASYYQTYCSNIKSGGQ